MADIVLVHDYELKRQAVYKTPRYGLSFSATDTEKSFTIQANGQTERIILEVPDGWTPNVTLTVVNSDGVTILDSGAKNPADFPLENGYRRITMVYSRPLVGENTIKVSFASAPGAGTVYVTVYVI